MIAPPALDDAQVERLSYLLDQFAVPNQGLNMEALDGFLSALAVGPEMVLPSEWQPLVWGSRPVEWSSEEQALEVHTLLVGHWNTCIARSRHGDDELPDYLSPLLWLPENPDAEQSDELDVGRDWAHGFFAGVECRADAWQAWLDENDWIDEIFALLEQLATGEVASETEAPGETVTYVERISIVASLPGMLADLQQHRLEAMTPRIPARRAPTPERNAACPCGSGRKYKKCHGAAN